MVFQNIIENKNQIMIQTQNPINNKNQFNVFHPEQIQIC